ncbi:MAG: GNAT family N-acetyltransferase [Eubacteriales bacterium]|nr:GNAT family N-acetyltransferase [Eubacteriales bacterium]
MRLETKRLILREYTMDDLDSLYEILSDPESMRYYPAPFGYERCGAWIQWNLENYEKYGFGLWAVVRKEDGRFIGDCGITMQMIDASQEPEIGFHIHKAYTRSGYATEAACVCRDFAFKTLGLSAVYCYQKYTNVPSQKTAEKMGMKRLKQYPDPKNEFTTVYALTKETYFGTLATNPAK